MFFATFVIREVWTLVFFSWATFRRMYTYLHFAFHMCCYSGGLVINKDKKKMGVIIMQNDSSVMEIFSTI